MTTLSMALENFGPDAFLITQSETGPHISQVSVRLEHEKLTLNTGQLRNSEHLSRPENLTFVAIEGTGWLLPYCERTDKRVCRRCEREGTVFDG